MLERTRLIDSLRSDCEISLKKERRAIKDLEEAKARLDRERRGFEEKLGMKEKEIEGSIRQIRGKHQEDLNRVRGDYDQSLAQIRAINVKDKEMLESMLKQC